jgi:TolB-like protein
MDRKRQMIRLIYRIVVIYLLSFMGQGLAQMSTLAVLDFENNSLFQSEQYQPLAKGLAEIVITELSRVQTVRVVERRELRSLLEEMKLSQTGSVSSETSVQVGRLLGAHYLVFGGYMVAMDEKIRIDVRIVEVETGLTVKAEEVTGKTDKVLSLLKKLSKKILDDLDIKLTKNEQKALDRTDNFDIKAIMYFSKGVEFEDLGQWDKAKINYQKALDIEPNMKRAVERLRAVSERGTNE